jgi:hypothetical protein
MFGSISRGGSSASGPIGLVRTLVVLAFAVIQLVLVARILLDLGVIPPDLAVSDLIVSWSDALAAPVAGVATAVGGAFGAGQGIGDGLNATMVAALVGWSVVEGLVLGVIRKFAAV